MQRVLVVARLVVEQVGLFLSLGKRSAQLLRSIACRRKRPTPIFSKSSSSSATVVEAIGGAAGSPTYLATPERIETSFPCYLIHDLLRSPCRELQSIVWHISCIAPSVVLYLIPLFSQLFELLFSNLSDVLLVLYEDLTPSGDCIILEGLQFELPYLLSYSNLSSRRSSIHCIIARYSGCVGLSCRSIASSRFNCSSRSS